MGQSPIADFSVSLLPCLDQNIDVSNTSTNADLFEWDFCLDDFKTLSSNIDLATVTGLNGGFGYRIVEDDGSWFGFVVSQSTHSIIRLDFGDSPTNTPAVVDLGNPGNTLLFPQGIDLYKNNGVWFAFVGYNDNNYGLVRLDFGGSLINSPSAVNLGNFGVTGRFWDLKIIKQAGDLILVIIERNTGSIIRVNYRDSFLNSITIPTHVFNTGPIPGAALTPGIDVAKKGANWFVFLTSSSNKIYQVSFGSNILGSAGVDATYGFSGITNPFRIRLAQEGSNYFAMVSNQSAAMALIDLKDLDIANPPVEVAVSGLPQLLAVDIIRYQGKSIVQGVGNVTNKLKQLLFESACGASTGFSKQVNPNPVSYTSPGLKKIELKAFNSGSGEYAIAAQQITVSALTAPDISFTSQNSCANHDINFTSQNTSGDITDYNWNFGDMNTSMLQDPTHQYVAAADYPVSLQVTSSNGCNNLVRDTITIYNEPIANFNLPATSPICTNQDYLFTNTSTFDPGSNPSWQWEVNTIPVSSDQDLTYAITSPVQQDIKLIASIPGCTHEITQSILTVEEGPQANFTFSNGCQDTSIAFTNTTTGTVTGYVWDFGDGNMSMQTNASNTYTAYGPFDVTLHATNAVGCVNTSVQEITIYSKPQPDFSLDLPPFSCNGTPSQFNDLTPGPPDSNLDTWAWSFGDSQNGTSTIKDPQYTYLLSGDYNVSLDVTTNFGCSASTQKLITITESPSANFSFTPACVNQATTFTPTSTTGINSWQWKIGTATYNQQTPTHVFGTSNTFNAELTTIQNNGCVAVLSKQVTVPVPTTPNFSSANNCAQQNTVFTDLTPSGSDLVVSRAWQFGTLGTGTGPTTSFMFPAAGSYPTKLTVTNESGCSYIISKNVSISNSPIPTFTATPLVGTVPLTVQLVNTSTNVASQLWSVNDPASSTSTASSAQFLFNELGQYVVDLTVTNPEGCSATSSKIISVIVPSLDLELTSLSLYPWTNGEINLLVSVKNNSNTPITNPKIAIDISGQVVVNETLNVVIQPTQTHSQVLTTGIVDANGGVAYVCAEVILDGDINKLNNKLCLNQESNTVVLDPYPNPGSDQMTIEWISESQEEVDIFIFDPVGRKVFDYSGSNFDSGLNRIAIPLQGYNPGIYHVLFVSGGTRKSFRYIVRR